jgi:quinol-cytochrome oxidoreductase complex cytochrome b subunit
MRNDKIILILGVGFVFVAQSLDSIIMYIDIEENSSTAPIWGFLGYYFICLWIFRDAKNQDKIYKPFDFGFLIYLFMIPYIPYYIVKTRRLTGFLKLIAILVILVTGTYSGDIIQHLTSEP